MLIFLPPFNIEAEFAIYILVTFPIGFAFFITLRNYRREKNLHNCLFMCAWLSYLVWGIFNALELIYLEPILVILAGIATTLMGFFTVIFLDKISRQTVDPVKLCIVVAFAAVKIMILTDPSAIIIVTEADGQQRMLSNFPYLLVSIMNLLFIGFCYLYYMVRIHQNAPANLKSASRQSLWGACFMGIFGPITGLVFNSIAPAIIGVGALITAFAFSRQPQLAYILPFKTYRLIVIDMVGGIPLFSHDWADTGVTLPGNFELFSAMLAGINGVIQESLQKGGVRQIQLERSLLILEPGTNIPFISILITTQSSTSLCAALKTFTKKFEMAFGNRFPEVHNTSAFNDAENLISECFPFVPTYL